MAKDKKKNTKPKGKGGSNLGFKGTFLLIVLVAVSIAFLPTALLLFFGMLPSFVLLVFGNRKRGPRASTVAAMNLAGCIPFIFKLWSGANDFEASVDIVTDPASLSVIYMSAAFGYMIDWFVTGLVSSYLYQKGLNRMKAIKKRQKVLVDFWGEEVAGGAIIIKEE